MTQQSVLQINSSGRYQDSITRQVAAQVLDVLREHSGVTQIVERDLATGLPFIDEQWIGANFTAPEERTEAHRETLALSDALVGELQAAGTIVIASPIYNFSIPAVLKAWIDLVARARLTFRYTDKGPVGLLQHKSVYLVMASGGVPIGSEVDFASRYLRQVLAFIGLDQVTVIDCGKIKSTQDLLDHMQLNVANAS